MPRLHWVEVSLTLRPKCEKIPEFPRPEAPQLPGPSPGNPNALQPGGTDHHCTVGSGASIRRLDTIAVYVPSSPGAIPARERWHDTEAGSSFQPQGIEARSFCFAPDQSSGSVAEDGGLIEIKVYRSKGRRRRAPTLQPHRNQDQYGTLLPSLGLVERPEDQTFFDWHLIDPRDSPLATFRFRYRCWKNLLRLNLVPGEPSLAGKSSAHTGEAPARPNPRIWDAGRYRKHSCSHADDSHLEWSSDDPRISRPGMLESSAHQSPPAAVQPLMNLSADETRPATALASGKERVIRRMYSAEYRTVSFIYRSSFWLIERTKSPPSSDNILAAVKHSKESPVTTTGPGYPTLRPLLETKPVKSTLEEESDESTFF